MLLKMSNWTPYNRLCGVTNTAECRFYIQISPQKFDKILNPPRVPLVGPGEMALLQDPSLKNLMIPSLKGRANL